MFGTMIACRVKMTTKVQDKWYELGVKCQGQICLKSVFRIVTILIFDAGWPFIAQ